MTDTLPPADRAAGSRARHAVDLAMPTLHGRPPSGWINDPNGLCRIDGTWHVYYQYNPNAPVHADVHWGHMTSPDLLNWSTEPVALAPRPGGADGGGVWSGCMTIDDGVPTAVYTGVDGEGVARALLARGDADARRFTRDEPPAAGMPDGPDITDLRDPYLFTFSGRRWVVQGAGRPGGVGSLLVYDAQDLRRWHEHGELLRSDHPNLPEDARADIWECPNLVQIDGHWVLLVSIWREVPGRSPLHHVSWILGDLLADAEGIPRFEPTSSGRLDSGTSYYAAQALAVDDRVLVWGWAWESDRGSDRIAEAPWQGVLTFPRELTVTDGRVRVRPATELKGLREAPASPELLPAAFEVVLTEPAPLQLLLDDAVVWGDDVPVSRVLIDASIIEVFTADGSAATVRAYPGPDSRWQIRSGADVETFILAAPTR